ncbi:MAG TPA: zinc ribbon domain-containing protein [Firmicutes bacterium]|nr:zinc ribbon domain-containing protein [Bacillota bacterium]
MPLYDYRCEQCKQVFEVRMSLREKEEGRQDPCPNCGSDEVKQFFGSVGYIRACTVSSGGGFT